MQVYEVIEKKRDEVGISTAELARRTGIEYQNLWVSLKGDRRIPAPEFVELCKQLNLNIEDFSEQ